MAAIPGFANHRFADRIPPYLQNCRQNGIAMGDALDRVDFETVKTLAHQMSGSGGMYGFQAITDIGAALERTAGCVDTDASRRWVGELASYLDPVSYTHLDVYKRQMQMGADHE